MQMERQMNWSMFRVGQLDSHSDINRRLVNDKFIEMVIPILMIFDPSLVVSIGIALVLFHTFSYNVVYPALKCSPPPLIIVFFYDIKCLYLDISDNIEWMLPL